jgi:hypothetical protein
VLPIILMMMIVLPLAIGDDDHGVATLGGGTVGSLLGTATMMIADDECF